MLLGAVPGVALAVPWAWSVGRTPLATLRGVAALLLVLSLGCRWWGTRRRTRRWRRRKR